jgi:hypothetical protein
MKKEWIPVENLLEDTHPSVCGELPEGEGVIFDLFVSPYDVPRLVSGYRDEDSGSFFIEFKYLEEEPTRKRRIDGHVVFHVGKHSKRIYKIEVDIDGLGVAGVGLRLGVVELIEEALDSLPVGKFRASEQAKSAVSSIQNRLFENLPC